MILELHILQNFAPSNLNRDDTGSPKDCEFGGHRRARISSQCFKRAIRTEPSFYKFLLQNNGGVRTRRLILEIAERLTEERPVSEKIVKLVSEVFAEGGIERPKSRKGEDAEKDQTKLLLFMERKALDEMAALFKTNWDELTKGNKETRGNLVSSLGAELATRVKAPDIALFGRMVEIEGAKPFGKLNLGIDAACQVAHAISTNFDGGAESAFVRAGCSARRRLVVSCQCVRQTCSSESRRRSDREFNQGSRRVLGRSGRDVMYGKDQIKGVWVTSLAQNGLVNLKNEKVANLKELIGGVMSKLDERSREAQ